MLDTIDPSHHDACRLADIPIPEDVCLNITVGHRNNGEPFTTVKFASGETLVATPADPDLGFDAAHTVLHDVTHTLLACLLGLDRSPVLERVVELRSLSQEQVDLEEAAAFAIHAWCSSLRDEDTAPAIANIRTALDRLENK